MRDPPTIYAIIVPFSFPKKKGITIPKRRRRRRSRRVRRRTRHGRFPLFIITICFLLSFIF